MRVRLLLFAQLRERCAAGADVLVEVREGARVEDVLSHLEAEGTLDAALLPRVAVAVNREYARRDFLLHEGDEVAVLPPVSGGAR